MTETREDVAQGAREEATVTAHESCPDTTVFTEEGNRDGWIATDVTVELRR